MFKKILLAYDGSDRAKKAFERCLEMARCFGAELSIVQCMLRRAHRMPSGPTTARNFRG